MFGAGRDEFGIVGDGRFGEEVEPPIWPPDIKTCRCENLMDAIAAGFIAIDVHTGIDGFRDHTLQERRRIDKAQHPVTVADGLDQVGVIFTTRTDPDVADPFTRQGQGFAPAVADDAIGQVSQIVRCLLTIKRQTSVRLIGQDIDRLAGRKQDLVQGL